MVMYDENIFVLINNIILFKNKILSILKYKFIIMCMFNTHNYYLFIDWVLVYNIWNNDT
jgi:hypothetical protein